MDDLMKEAWDLTHGDRRAAYGSPADVFEGYALMWTGLLQSKLKSGASLSALDVTLMMTALKLARESNAPKRDNIVDAHGYLALHTEIKEAAQRCVICETRAEHGRMVASKWVCDTCRQAL